MKTLVVYYSHDGNTKFISQTMADAIEADVAELKPQKTINASGVMMFAWGVRQLVSQSEPKLLALDKNPKDYDLIIIGTPVWTYTMAPPVRTFLKHHTLSGKKIALFCCHGGDKRKTLLHMKEFLKENQIIGEFDFLEPMRHEKEVNQRKAVIWAKSLIEK